LVINDTKVLPARLVGYRTQTKGRWEGLFLEVDGNGNWKVLGKTRGKIQAGETVTLQDPLGHDDVKLNLLTQLAEGAWAARPDSDEDLVSLLERVGRVPLPHYIRGGEMIAADRDSYQTVFADKPGAVAAPTAGLHFTPTLVDRLKHAGIDFQRVTLHVGIGTFRPIKVAQLDDHRMHEEWGNLDQQTADQLDQCRRQGGRVISVGTTSVRVLETAWENGCYHPWQGKTDLFIRPPYQFDALDALVTNFHLPMSSLLVLVRTFGGDELMRRAYEEAIAERYRFFSYGDTMLIL
jgi:S-adenosylmethionine:tRNA ribosyltransferase-isomerase